MRLSLSRFPKIKFLCAQNFAGRLVGLFVFVLCVAPGASAQMDSSSALLLSGDHSSNTSESTTPLDTSHYTIRPRDPAPVRPVRKSRPAAPADLTPVTVSVPAPAQTPVPIETLSPRVAATPTPAIEEQPQPAVIYLPNGTSTPSANRDPGKITDLIELSVAPGFLYNDSSSIYSFRNYSNSSPTVGVDANVWLIPSFGLHGSYLRTLNDSVSDSLNGTREVPISQDWFAAGVKSRQYFGFGVLAPSMTFGLDFVQYSFHVDSTSQIREHLTSNGAQLSVEADIPVTANRAWTFSIQVAPILGHSENSSSVSYASGTSPNSSSVGFSIGNRYQLSHSDAVFWKASVTVEKDLFSGTATAIDPVSGIAPSGVSVTNSFSLIQVGYSWGN